MLGRPADGMILEIERVVHRYTAKQEKPALSLDSFALARGEIVGLIGPNGSGKSTLLRLLSCVERCSAGTVRFHGQPATPFAGGIRGRVALLPQEAYLLKRTVFENVAYGLRVRGETSRLASRVGRALELVGLSDSLAGRQWHALSGGEAQRVALAARLVLQPECLLLDEPTASVDIQSAALIRQAVRAARDQWGTALVIASHQRAWLNGICDRLVFLYEGRRVPGDLENILFGPWRKEGAHSYYKVCADGQKIAVGVPPAAGTSCLIAAEQICVRPAAGAGGGAIENALRGTVTGIFLEQGSVAMQVCCGGQTFTVRQGAGGVKTARYAPGDEVVLFFPPHAVVWLKG